MGVYFPKKRENLELILRAIEQPESVGDGSFAGKPVLLWLESTARCNLRCTKCGHAYDSPGSARTLPRNLADAVVDEADDYFRAAVKVRTSGYGEMFLFSRLRSLVERIKRYECWTEGTTNGVVIDRSEVDWLVDLGYDQLVFSIDGVKPETMQRLRGADLNRIWDILGYIQRRKEETGSARPQIVVGFVAQADNIEELPDLVRKLGEFGVCFLAIATLHYKKYVPGGDDSYGRLYRDYGLGNVPRERVQALLEEAKSLAAKANIGCETYFDLDRIYREAAEDAETAEEEFNDAAELVSITGLPAADSSSASSEPLKPFYCVYPWTSLFVTARGSTSVCCSMRGDVGTVLESGDLDRVWNGDKLRAIRQSIARGEVHPSCAYCVSRDRHLSSFVDLKSVESALSLQAEPEITVNGSAAEIPVEPLFGYFDTRLIEARGSERVRVAGWVASGKTGAPVSEIRLKLGGRELAAVRNFHARPDVAAYYGRKDLLRSGWQTLVHLPNLAPGEYELTAEATDPEGVSGAIGPALVRISA